MLFVGEWAPIVGTGIAGLGSLYLYLAEDVEAVKKDSESDTSVHHFRCSHPDHVGGLNPSLPPRISVDNSQGSSDTRSTNGYVVGSPSHIHTGLSLAQDGETDQLPQYLHSLDSPDTIHMEIVPTNSRPSFRHGREDKRSSTADVGSRRKMARTLTAISTRLGSVRPPISDDSGFRRGLSSNYPEIPAELQRNSALLKIRKHYNPRRDADGNVTPVPGRSRSREPNLAEIVASSATPRSASPYLPHSPSSPSHFPSRNQSQIPDASTSSATKISSEPHNLASSSSAYATDAGLQSRPERLQVPEPIYTSPNWRNQSALSDALAKDPDRGRSKEVEKSS